MQSLLAQRCFSGLHHGDESAIGASRAMPAPIRGQPEGRGDLLYCGAR
jgi:hypothetical protein